MEAEEERVQWVRRLLSWLAPHKLNVGIAFGAGLLGTGVAGLTPLVQKVVVDDVTAGTGDAIAPWLLLLALAGAARFALAYVRRFYGGRVAADVQYDLRTALFRHVQRLDVASHDQMQTGQLVARASTDVNSLHHLLSFLPLVLGNVLLFFIALGVMIKLSPLLSLLVFAVVPLMAVATARVRRTIFPASWDASQQSGVVAGIVEESVTGVRVVKGFGQEDRALVDLTAAAGGLSGRACATCGCRRGTHLRSRRCPCWPRWRRWPSVDGWPSTDGSRSARSSPSPATSFSSWRRSA